MNGLHKSVSTNRPDPPPPARTGPELICPACEETGFFATTIREERVDIFVDAPSTSVNVDVVDTYEPRMEGLRWECSNCYTAPPNEAQDELTNIAERRLV